MKSNENSPEHSIERAIAVLTAGQALIFPTDTVYGLGLAVGIADTPESLYHLKGRGYGKPIAWLVGNPEALTLYGKSVPEFASALARTFWPGPLTLIVKAAPNVRESFRAPDGTIALRMPNNRTALELIQKLGVPLATTSANLSGQKPPKTFDDLDPALLKQVQVALRDDSEKSGFASTVIDCTKDHPILVREGGISIADIQALG